MSTRTRDRRTPTRERERILRSRNRFWRLEDLAGHSSTKQHLLADLVADGELRRIRRGLYWRGTKSPLGMAPPPTDTLVSEIAPGPGVGPAGLYAANLLRLSTQVPRLAEIAVPMRAPEALGNIRFLARPTRTARATAGLNQTEVALLEVLGSWESTIELPPNEAWNRMQQLFASGTVRAERLGRAARTEPANTRTRLRELLHAAGYEALAERVPDSDERSKALANKVLVAAR